MSTSRNGSDPPNQEFLRREQVHTKERITKWTHGGYTSIQVVGERREAIESIVVIPAHA